MRRWIKISSRKASPIPSGITKEKRYLVSWRFEAFFREVSRTILQWRAESYSYISCGLGQIPPLALMASSIYISACWNPLYEVSPPLPHPLNLTLTSNHPCLANARFLPPSMPPLEDFEGFSRVKLSHSRSTKRNRKGRFLKIAILTVCYDLLSLGKCFWEALYFDLIKL